MTAMGLGESAVRRVAVIGAATAIVLIALLSVKPFYSAMTDPTAASSAGASRAVDQEPATEKASFVTSPTTEANPRFFFGTGDGSNGYYAERPEPKSDSVR